MFDVWHAGGRLWILDWVLVRFSSERQRNNSPNNNSVICVNERKTSSHSQTPRWFFSACLCEKQDIYHICKDIDTVCVFLCSLIASAWQQLSSSIQFTKQKPKKTEKPLQRRRTKAEFILFPTRSEPASVWVTTLTNTGAHLSRLKYFRYTRREISWNKRNLLIYFSLLRLMEDHCIGHQYPRSGSWRRATRDLCAGHSINTELTDCHIHCLTGRFSKPFPYVLKWSIIPYHHLLLACTLYLDTDWGV